MQVFYYSINSLGVRYKELNDQGVDDFEWASMIERGIVGAREARWLANYKGFKPWLVRAQLTKMWPSAASSEISLTVPL